MKKRTAFIGAILSLIPLGQPLLIKTSVLSTTGLMISFPEKVPRKTHVKPHYILSPKSTAMT